MVIALMAGGMLLRSPSLNGSLMGDDWDHYAMVMGFYPVQLSPFDLFNFVPRDRADYAALRSSGRLPWWSDPGLHLGFFRPIASALIWADFAVLHGERSPRRRQLHSLMWWAASVFAVAAVLRQVLPLPAAIMGVLLYTVDDGLALPVAWSASRSELIAITLMFFALAAHLDWKRRRLARSRWLALGLLWLAVWNGEYSIALFAFVIACELADVATPLRERIATLASMSMPIALYVSVRASLGYGARGTSFYIDPLSEPARYLHALMIHVPVLAGDLCWGYAADNWYAGPMWREQLLDLAVVPSAWLELEKLRMLQLTLGWFGLIVIVMATRWLWRAAKPGPALSALLLGSLLALLPLAGALPMSRLTVGPSLAFDAAFAWLFTEAWKRLRTPEAFRAKLLLGLCCAFIVGEHGIHAGLRSRTLAELYASSAHIDENWVAYARLDASKLPKRHVFIVSAPDVATQMSLPYIRHLHHTGAPNSSEILLPPMLGEFQLSRPSASTLEVSVPKSDEMSDFRHSAYLLAEHEFSAGQRFPGARFATIVVSVKNGLPTKLRFDFARSLDDASYLFVYPTEDGLLPIAVPAIGSAVKLPPPTWPHRLGAGSDHERS
jgi:hypothetical protein